MFAKWWLPIAIVLVSGLAGVVFMGIRTYQDAPPIPDFVNEAGQVIVSRDSIIDGQLVFQKYALMDYGSMFGDGAGRGPDFTADALHQLALSMTEFYNRQRSSNLDNEDEQAAIRHHVQTELKHNRYESGSNRVTISAAENQAVVNLNSHYLDLFLKDSLESMHPKAYIKDEKEIKNLSSFFFWGAWVCATLRPGHDYSYTHNWPFDEMAGNTPSWPITFWSVAGCLGLMLGLGAVLYMRGKLDPNGNSQKDQLMPVMTSRFVSSFSPSDLQKSSYKFFAVAALLFFLQVLTGVLTIHDFVHFTTFGGVDIAKYLPLTVTRSWHLQLSLMWITSCWIGASIFVMPMLSKSGAKGQLALTNLLFCLLLLTVGGSVIGVFLGPMGMLKDWWLLGNQGWEFVELGKLWQALLFVCLGLWAVILFRGLSGTLKGLHPTALPNWLFYSVLCVLCLFVSGFVAEPKTNFVIADFWRWCVIHMWVEAFFEVFTTALIACFMYLMGLVSFNAASRTVYLSTLLFLGSGIIGISHNFYWNAKPVETLALGSVFSTLQVVPLILLTLEAWRVAKAPQAELRKSGASSNEFAHADTYLFLLGVNFWNFCGAGAFGFIINLPIVNYYEHGTYLTVNHGHAALMGVYGNLAIAALLFCLRFLKPVECWNSRLLQLSFWSMNVGLMLMVLLDLFPAGAIQLCAVLEHGLWFARSQQFILSMPFQTLTWMRIVGGAIFFLAGVLPLTWFVVSKGQPVENASPSPQPETTMSAV